MDVVELRQRHVIRPVRRAVGVHEDEGSIVAVVEDVHQRIYRLPARQSRPDDRRNVEVVAFSGVIMTGRVIVIEIGHFGENRRRQQRVRQRGGVEDESVSVVGSASRAGQDVVAAISIQPVGAGAAIERVVEGAAGERLRGVGSREVDRARRRLPKHDIAVAGDAVGAGMIGPEGQVTEAVAVEVARRSRRVELIAGRRAVDPESVGAGEVGETEIGGKAGGLAVDHIDGARIRSVVGRVVGRDDHVVETVAVDVAGRGDRYGGSCRRPLRR